MHFSIRQKLIRKLVRSLAGRLTFDGGDPGHLVRCSTCHGEGLLFSPLTTIPRQEPTPNESPS